MFKRFSTFIIGVCLIAGTATADTQKDPQVMVISERTDTAGSMLAYTEFELSGEPLAEGLGLDLDVLDPNMVNLPTTFDYAAGIESYESSEEAMYSLDYQSKMGPHLINGPLNKMRGGTPQAFGKRLIEFAKATSFPPEELPLNLYPITLPYSSGVGKFAQPVDTSIVNVDEIELITAHGKTLKAQSQTPAYFRDFETLGWVESEMDKAFEPAAIGGAMLKEVMWAQDFLGGMHTIEGDEEVEAENSKMDQDGKHAFGVSSADGVNGMILTEIVWDKLLILQERLAYDGKKLGAKITPQYDPEKQKVWFPHRIDVDAWKSHGVKSIRALTVTDPYSTLRDTWMLLWPISEVLAFSDQREANKNQNPAFTAVFDGAPFKNAPKRNIDNNLENDVAADDPFSIANNLSNILFKNLSAIHYDKQMGSLVDGDKGRDDNQITTLDAGYAIVAMRVYRRAIDALPVGYEFGGGSEGLETEKGKKALSLIKNQADFIMNNLISPDNLVFDGFSSKHGVIKTQTIESQFAAIRGLTAAFLSTKDSKYRNVARKICAAVEKHMFDPQTGTYADHPGRTTDYTSYTVAAVSGGLRDMLLTLRNEEEETESALEVKNIVGRYTEWFKVVINGLKADEGMQMAEWLGDSGENIIKGEKSNDTDQDNVPQITNGRGKYGIAQTMASRVRVSPSGLRDDALALNLDSSNNGLQSESQSVIQKVK